MPDASLSRSWFRPQLSLGSLLWAMLVVGIGVTWWNDRRDFDLRLRKMEQTYYPAAQSLWGATEILGAPDDLTGLAGKSWCPMGSQAADWVEVSYDRAVAAATIDLYETYAVGCVTEVLVVDRNGRETSIWKGADPTSPTSRTGLLQIPVPSSIKGGVQGVKIHVDSVGKGHWACFDAVGLTTAQGKTTWATSSTCSSVYGNGDLTATTQKSFWRGLW